ncbi:anti-sigma factor antagonist [Streptomyces sp. DW26H14]|uniref:anti-sigma factor antagonist n=1 Tax=Streptomyces sp. DW26H14 TaxID=3435395 RepID=UPI00403D9420
MLPPPSADRAMELTTRREGTAVVLVVEGELDLDTVAPLTSALSVAAEEAAGTGAVVLDLSGVLFADSTTVNVLLQARASLGDRLRVARPSAFVQRLFSVIGLGEALGVYGSVPDALVADGGPTGGSEVSGVGE